MKFLFYRDNTVKVDLHGMAGCLNRLVKEVSFAVGKTVFSIREPMVGNPTTYNELAPAIKGEIRTLSGELKQNNVVPWLDEEQLRPGIPFVVKSWQQMESHCNAQYAIGEGILFRLADDALEILRSQFVTSSGANFGDIMAHFGRIIENNPVLEVITNCDNRRSKKQ